MPDGLRCALYLALVAWLPSCKIEFGISLQMCKQKSDSGFETGKEKMLLRI